MEEQTVVSEAPVETTVNADSSVEDIIASRSEADDEVSVTDTETEQSDETGEVVKAQSEEVSEKSDDVVEGDPIPYPRFKEVNSKLKTFEAKTVELESELEEARSVLQDPDVLELALRKKGYTDKAIDDYFKSNGISRSQAEGTKDYDLSTTEGWQDFIRDEISKSLNPINQTLSQKEQMERQERHNAWVSEQETKAREISKSKYDIEFGEIGKDEANPNTAVGKMWAYLNNGNMEDAKLGYVKLLKLVLSEDAVKQGQETGVQKERERQKLLKTASMESDASVSVEERPNKDWDADRIIAWRHKNEK